MSLRVRGAWSDLTNMKDRGEGHSRALTLRLRFQNSAKRLEFLKHHSEEIVMSLVTQC